MKFNIIKRNFLEALNTVSKIIVQNTVSEAQKGIKIELYKDKMILKGSDSMVFMEYSLEAVNEDKEVITILEEGELVAPTNYFLDIIRKAPTEIIEIESNGSTIKIKSGKSEFNIQGYDIDEYPEFPIIEKENKFTISTKLFNDIIRETLFCTAVNDQRPILEGVNVVLENKFLTATATDSHRLSKRRLLLDNIEDSQNFNIIIPRKSLQSIQKIIENKDEDLEIYYEENRIVFVYRNIIYSAILISGKYPNTEKLVPSIFECTVVANSKEMYHAVDRVSLVSKDEKNDIVKLAISDGVVNLYAYSKELGTAEEDFFAETYNEEGKFEIAVSAKFLKEAISAINSENVIVKFSGELTAFIMQPSDYHRDILEVLLPVRTY